MASRDNPGAEHQRAVANVSKVFTERLRSGNFDDLTVREVRVKAVQEVEQLLDNDAQASAVSIIVFIIWGNEQIPGEQVIR